MESPRKENKRLERKRKELKFVLKMGIAGKGKRIKAGKRRQMKVCIELGQERRRRERGGKKGKESE